MNIRMGKNLRRIVLSFVVALCAIFSFGLIFASGTASASGGIYVEDGGKLRNHCDDVDWDEF